MLLGFLHLGTVGSERGRDASKLIMKPLSPSIKLKILLLCFHTFLTEVAGRSC